MHFLCLSCSKGISATQQNLSTQLVTEDEGEDTAAPAAATATSTISPTTPPTTPPTTVPTETEVVTTPATTTAAAPSNTERRRTIRVSLCDLYEYDGTGGQANSLCTGTGISKIYGAFLAERSYSELVRVCNKYITDEMVLVEILGATDGLGGNSEIVTLGDDEEVEAWLEDTVDVRPLRVLAIYRKRLWPQGLEVTSPYR